jgi:hypothetical protein
MAFPTLSRGPKSVTMTPVDNTLRTPTDAGYVQTRSRYTRQIYDFDVSYLLTAADRTLMLAHDASVQGSTIFTWVYKSVTYNVRYTKRVQISATPDVYGNYQASFGVQSV